MNISNTEKLILLMLCDIRNAQESSKTNASNSFEQSPLIDDPNFISNALFQDTSWSIPVKYPAFFDDANLPLEVSMVMNHLEMWARLEEAFQALSQTDQSTIITARGPVKFPGYDGNNETSELIIAETLVERLNRFAPLKGKIINSHCEQLNTYQTMYDKFKPLASKFPLTAVEILDILG